MTERQDMTRLTTVRGARPVRAGARRTDGARLAAVILRGGGLGSPDRHRSDPSRPVPDRVPDDPDDRLAVPAAGHRGLRPRRWPCWSSPAGRRQPAGCRGGRRLRPRHPRRLPPVGLDRAVRVQGGPHDGGDRRRYHRGGRLRRPGRARACSPPAATAGGRPGTAPAGSRPGSRRPPPGRPEWPPPAWRLRPWCCSASRSPALAGARGRPGAGSP